MQLARPGAAGRYREHLIDFYEAAAPHYNGWCGGVHGRAAGRLVEVLAVRPSESLLDIGCGTGLVAHLVGADPKLGGYVCGVDISPHMLDVAEGQRPPASRAVFAEMAAEGLVMRSQSFDAVTLGQVLPHLLDPRAVLLEVRRVVRRGGRVALSCQRRSLASPAEEILFDELAELALRHPTVVPRPPAGHAMLGEPQTLARLLADCGFHDVYTTQMVTGNHAADLDDWLSDIALAGPYPYALLSHLGTQQRERLRRRIAFRLRLAEVSLLHYHRAYTIAVARRP